MYVAQFFVALVYDLLSSKIGLYHLFLLRTSISQQNLSSETSILLSTISNSYDTFHYVAFKTFEFLTDSIAFFILAVPKKFRQENKETK